MTDSPEKNSAIHPAFTGESIQEVRYDFEIEKIFVPCAAALLVFGSLAACSKPGQSSDSSAASSQGAPIASSSQAASSSVDPSAVSSGLDSQSPSSQLSDAQKTLMQNMQKAAQQGKVINCDFAVKSNVIEDVQDKWGKKISRNISLLPKGCMLLIQNTTPFLAITKVHSCLRSGRLTASLKIFHSPW